MEKASSYEYLRQKLDLLGYESEILPISALSIVSSLIDDLIITTEALKSAKDDLGVLLEEKKTWELGNEVYKCDNSKLLSEVNRLKIELLNKERKVLSENADLKKKIRVIEAERREADEKIASLIQTINQYNASDKHRKHLKPFVSTVRSNSQFPEASNLDAKGKCDCSTTAKKSSIRKEIEKLRVDLQHADHIYSVIKKQNEEKDREIQRLNCLLIGGRPVSALAKDCCYKEVSKISEDVGILQKDKLDLQKKLKEFEFETDNLRAKTQQQSQKINKLEAFIREISDAALYVEREANLKIKNNKREIEELKENVTRSSTDYKSQENLNLKKKLREMKKIEQRLMFEIEYLKNKLSETEQKLKEPNSQLVDDLMKERDILQVKLKTFEDHHSHPHPHPHPHHHPHQEHHNFYSQLKDKELHISKLEEELKCMRASSENFIGQQGSHAALNATNYSRRVECERDCALNKIQSLKIENESLNDKIKIMSDAKLNENHRIIHYEETIAKLKHEISDLNCAKTPTFQTIKQLREEICELQIKLRSSEEDYNKLNCNFNQLKMISQQTESVLMTAQNQLEFTKCELNERESQICCLNKSNECLKEQIEKLSSEISKLKTLKSTAEREKDFYMMSLDKKSEKLQCVESKVESVTQLTAVNHKLKAHNDDLGCEIKRLESIVCDIRSENSCLCKQLESTKHHLTNAIHENSRMVDELSSITAELNSTKKKFIDSQKDSEVIRTKLQNYIHEIERIDGLIAIKDTERKQAVLQAKDLECDNVKLIEKIDQNTVETKKTITELEHQITLYQDRLRAKCDDLENLEKQILDLSSEIECLRDANAKLYVDLDAQIYLTEKLEVQKEKQKAELVEYELSVRELISKNDKLKEEISTLRDGNTSETVGGTASYHPTM